MLKFHLNGNKPNALKRIVYFGVLGAVVKVEPDIYCKR